MTDTEAALKNEALERAIKNTGGPSALARLLGANPQLIVHWRKRGVPAERVLDIERATIDPASGLPRVTRHELRPDLYPADEQAA